MTTAPTTATGPTAQTATTAPTAATTTALTPDPAGSPALALARCVGDPDHFLATHFTLTPHRWRGDGHDDLLSLADVDALLTGAGLRRPAVRAVRDGEVIDPGSWTRRAKTGNHWIDDLAAPGRLLDLFHDGATIVLQSLQRWWPPLTRFCRDLELSLGHAVQANAYLTPAGAAGLAPHHDTHDVFVLQLHGTKHWTIRAPLVDMPLARHHSDHEAAATSPVLFEADLVPGDCLYLPRGFIHSAAAQTGASLHVTIGVLATTAYDVLRRLMERAGDEPAFRHPLPVGYAADRAVAAQVVKDVAADFAAWLARMEPAEIADVLVTSATARRQPLLTGQLIELIGLEAIDDATIVARRPGIVCDVTMADDRVRVGLGDRTVELPATLAETVHRLLDGTRHRVGDLADALDGGSRLVLVRRLVREGLLRTVDGP